MNPYTPPGCPPVRIFPCAITGGPRRSILCRCAAVLLALTLAACMRPAVWAPYEPQAETVYPGVHWAKVERPEQLGWSSAKLDAARRFSRTIGSAAVMIVDDGVVVAAWGDVRRNYQCHSMRKSILSGLIGIHVAEGQIDLAATMAELGIDDHPPVLSPLEKQATVGDLIRARSGIYHPAVGESRSMQAMRPARYSHPPRHVLVLQQLGFQRPGHDIHADDRTGDL